MKSESSFEFDGDLILVEAIVAGPKAHAIARLVLDTGAALTTLVPEFAEAIGYTSADRVARSVVRSAVANERGYVIRLPQFTALGFAVPDVHVNVAALGGDLNGLLGMNFLSRFNFEIRPAAQRILVEKLDP
ncbi:MAG TPA: retroviral-like aspartic protease family protein [Kofleriaceae bacterium]